MDHHSQLLPHHNAKLFTLQITLDTLSPSELEQLTGELHEVVLLASAFAKSRNQAFPRVASSTTVEKQEPLEDCHLVAIR